MTNLWEDDMSTEMFDKGLQVRREVLGAEYVDGSMPAPTIS